MKIKEGMYVRTKDGRIGKVVDSFSMILDVNLDQKETRYILDSTNVYCYCEEDIKKSSYDIIDLIEVGDYINGFKITYIEEPNKYNFTRMLYFEEPDDYVVKTFIGEEIKTILTKEQFESMSYKVGEV